MKRFYARVEVVEVNEGFAIELDGRGIKMPAGNVLAVPTRPLADRISIEWAAQREEIDPASMPHTGLSNAAIDRIGPNRDTVIDELAAYLANDPIRYRATEPDDLVARQSATWDPILEGFEQRFGMRLATTTGFEVFQDPEPSVLCVRNYADAKTDFTLTGFANLAQHLGSVLIALGVSEGDIEDDAAFNAAYLEELHQADRWGIDKEAEDRRRIIRSDAALAHEFSTLAHPV